MVEKVTGPVLVVAGLVLAVFFEDTEFFWFRGGPLGLVLAVVGAIETWSAFRRPPDRSG
jgi:hypothetical protein